MMFAYSSCSSKNCPPSLFVSEEVQMMGTVEDRGLVMSISTMNPENHHVIIEKNIKYFQGLNFL